MPYVRYDRKLKTLHAQKRLSGISIAQANHDLNSNVSERSTIRWANRVIRTGQVNVDTSTYQRRGAPYIFDEDELQLIYEIIEDDSSLTIKEVIDIMKELVDKKVSLITMRTTVRRRLDYILENGDTIDPQQFQDQRVEYVRKTVNLPSELLVFLDEVGINEDGIYDTHLQAPIGACASNLSQTREPMGEHWTLCGAICEYGFIAGAAVSTGFNRQNIETFLEFVLLPRMNRYPNRNSVLIMDNAPIHKGEKIEELCNNAGVILNYLPDFSVDKDPMAISWLTLKDFLGKTDSFKLSDEKANFLVNTCTELFTDEMMRSVIRGRGYVPG